MSDVVVDLTEKEIEFVFCMRAATQSISRNEKNGKKKRKKETFVLG